MDSECHHKRLRFNCWWPSCKSRIASRRWYDTTATSFLTRFFIRLYINVDRIGAGVVWHSQVSGTGATLSLPDVLRDIPGETVKVRGYDHLLGRDDFTCPCGSQRSAGSSWWRERCARAVVTLSSTCACSRGNRPVPYRCDQVTAPIVPGVSAGPFRL